MNERNLKLKDKDVTNENLFWTRRKFLKTTGFSISSSHIFVPSIQGSEKKNPIKTNPNYANSLDGITDEKLTFHYSFSLMIQFLVQRSRYITLLNLVDKLKFEL